MRTLLQVLLPGVLWAVGSAGHAAPSASGGPAPAGSARARTLALATPAVRQPSKSAPGLTGRWQDDRGRRYRVRQVGDQVYWQAEEAGGGLAVFHGVLRGSQLRGRWVGLRGRQGAADLALAFRVVSNDLLEVRPPAPGFGLQRLQRVVLVKPALKLKVTIVAPGSGFQVSFTAPATWPRDAWVGIVPAHIPHGSEEVNDQHDLAYHYLGGRSQGLLTFTAPGQPGRFDLRMHDTDSGGREVAHVTFEVASAASRATAPRGAAPGTPARASLKLKQTLFTPGQTITVRFEAPGTWDATAWVGIVPANIPHGSEAVNDQHDLDYRYLNHLTRGQLTFTAPAQTGRYDLRMHDTDNNGREVTHVTFEVQ